MEKRQADLSRMPRAVVEFKNDCTLAAERMLVNLLYSLNRFTVSEAFEKARACKIPMTKESVELLIERLDASELVRDSNEDTEGEMVYFFPPSKVRVMVSVIGEGRNIETFNIKDWFLFGLAHQFGVDPGAMMEVVMELGIGVRTMDLLDRAATRPDSKPKGSSCTQDERPTFPDQDLLLVEDIHLGQRVTVYVVSDDRPLEGHDRTVVEVDLQAQQVFFEEWRQNDEPKPFHFADLGLAPYRDERWHSLHHVSSITEE